MGCHWAIAVRVRGKVASYWTLGWFFFFFSSRRRHTRLQGDWSSDVCSSDLGSLTRTPSWKTDSPWGVPSNGEAVKPRKPMRSEERRVGEEGRSRGAPYH